MKSWMVSGIVAGLMLVFVSARAEGDKTQDAKAPAKADAKPELKDIKLCGKLKCETKKDNTGKEIKVYAVVEKGGKKTKLPATAVKAEDVEALVDKDVDVVAKGVGTVIKEMVSVKACEHAAKTEAAPAAAAPGTEAPAAAAPTAAAPTAP